jgi:hypothetical protein
MHVRDCRDHFPFPTRLSGFAARYALVELEYCLVRLERDFIRLHATEPLTSLSLDVPANRVLVGASRDTDLVQEWLRAEYGPMIDVE